MTADENVLEGLDDWVLTDAVPDVVDRMMAMRRGVPAKGLEPRPAAAMRILHRFAFRRNITDLLECTEHFAQLDALAILATAALSRPVEEAALLALGQWERESVDGSGRTRLTDGIVHDVASQRTTTDVAAFIKKCQENPEAGLGDQTLRVFVGDDSGRTSLDKARLYILLRDDGCKTEAADLLKLAFLRAGKEALSAVLSDGSELRELADGLHHLSPAEPVMEEWIREAMKDPLNREATVELVANLLVSAPARAESLAAYVGRSWNHHDLAAVCERLYKGMRKTCDAVREQLAVRQDFHFLAEIIITWYQNPVLTKSTEGLITAVVTRGGNHPAGPHTKVDIDRIAASLKACGAPAACVAMLRATAAVHIEERSGAEVAELLHCVESGKPRRQAAQAISTRMADVILRSRTDADQILFVDYLKALQEREDGDSTYWALRQLPESAEGHEAREDAAATIGAIANRLYAEHLDDAGFNLLERCLENEQWVSPKDVGAVMATMHTSGMPDESRLDLLSATVGRWAELTRRGEAKDELVKRGFAEDANAVIHALR
jgi:hypothetical protein